MCAEAREEDRAHGPVRGRAYATGRDTMTGMRAARCFLTLCAAPLPFAQAPRYDVLITGGREPCFMTQPIHG